MVLLATVATVIASQSVISGAFSVTQQAVQLGFLPRLTIRHTSQREVGQVYAPGVNMGLFVIVVVIVIGFGSSAALASAYGVAVTGTFILNTILFLAVARLLVAQGRRLIALGAVAFLTVEIAFFAANLTKVVHGGWLPLVIAALVFTALTTWRKGREIVTVNRTERGGAAARLRRRPRRAPTAGAARARHGGLPERQPADHAARVARQRRAQPRPSRRESSSSRSRPSASPTSHRADRLACDDLGHVDDGITGLTARFGFQDEPDVPATLRLAAVGTCSSATIDLVEPPTSSPRSRSCRPRTPGMSAWRKRAVP